MGTHRYLARVHTLLQKLHRLLEERGVAITLTLLGVEHAGHILPAAVPELRNADLVSLELPTTPVKVYLSGDAQAADALHIRNIFWLDLLEYYRRSPPPHGVVGTNVNPHVRYLCARLYYRHTFLVNDFEAPPVAVAFPSETAHSLEELGGVSDTRITAAEVFDALPEYARRSYQTNGIVHVAPAENPFGPGRHLVVYREPDAEILEVERLGSRLVEGAARGCLPAKHAGRVVHSELLEGFLLPTNDFYLVEMLIEAILRGLRRTLPASCG